MVNIAPDNAARGLACWHASVLLHGADMIAVRRTAPEDLAAAMQVYEAVADPA